MRFLIYISLIAFTISSCYKDELVNSEKTISTPLPEIIIEETGLYGKVIDNDGLPSQIGTLEINGENFITESDYFYHSIQGCRKVGQFVFLKENQSYIGLVNAYLIENDVNYIEIKQLPQKEVSVFAEKIKISPDVELLTTEVGIYNNSGQEVTNNILVNHLQTSDKNILNNLGTSAEDNSGQLLSVKPMSLFYFDLTTNGEQLNVGDGGFSFECSQTFADLFWLDFSSDQWIMVDADSSVKLKPGFYMLAESTEGVYSEGKILKNQDPVSFMKFDWNEGSYSYNGYASSLGRWGSVTPVVSEVNYALNSPCGDFLQTEVLTIGESIKTDYIINVNDDLNNFVQVDTKVFDCDGNVEVIPAIVVENDEQNFIYLFNDDVIDTWLTVCNETFELGGYNILDDESGPLVNWSIGNNNEIDYLTNCDQYQDGYCFIKIGNDMRLYEPFEIDYNQALNQTTISEVQSRISFKFNGNVTGEYDETAIRLKIVDPNFTDTHGYDIECFQSGCGIDEFYVTHYETADGWLRISFSGLVHILQTGAQNLAGEFPVEGVILSKL